MKENDGSIDPTPVPPNGPTHKTHTHTHTHTHTKCRAQKEKRTKTRRQQRQNEAIAILPRPRRPFFFTDITGVEARSRIGFRNERNAGRPSPAPPGVMAAAEGGAIGANSRSLIGRSRLEPRRRRVFTGGGGATGPAPLASCCCRFVINQGALMASAASRRTEGFLLRSRCVRLVSAQTSASQ